MQKFVIGLMASILWMGSASQNVLAQRASKASPTVDVHESKPWEIKQPEKENLDLAMYQRIRVEALLHSHVMDYASALMDGIGPRLTGSPNMKKANEWTRDQFTAMGCSNAHLEDWGEFGMGWLQANVWLRMTSPDTAVFIAQAAPWSPPTDGPVSASAAWVEIKDEKDFEGYKGKLKGKIVFVGEMRDVKPMDKPLFLRQDAEELKKLEDYPPTQPNIAPLIKEYLARVGLREKIGKFLAEEGAIAAITPSRDGKDNGGSGGTIFDDSWAGFGRQTFREDHQNPLPVAVTAIENYGRVYRLLKAHVAVKIELNIDTKFEGKHEHGFDTIAEIPGTDPTLKDQVVMFGGHLDSWAAGTGATDNGAGSVVAMEAMRILTTLKVKPRRTIRVALWTGEEQGLFGSDRYVSQHFGAAPRSNDPEQLPPYLREATGPLELKAEQAKISGYFNVDDGSGKIRGVYLQGNAAVGPIFAQWMQPLKDLGVTTLTLRDTDGTDHLPFDAVGVPGFGFIQDPLEYSSRTHHSNMDTYERLQSDDLAQAALVEATFVYNAAMRDLMLPRKPLPEPENSKWKTVMPGATE